MTISTIPQLVSELKITDDDQQATKRTMYTWWKLTWRGILSEFLSTMMLVLFGCMACVPVGGLNMTINPPFSFGFVVMMNIQIFGHISGAYMNPAITLAAVLWGSVPIVAGIIYVLVECAGAILGYGILLALSPVDMVAEKVCVTQPIEGLTDLQALGIETALTIALTLINCGVWDPINASKQDSAPIKFGLTIVGLSLLGGQLTGTSMNPARTLGPAVWTGRWAAHWVYWVGPLLGALIGVLFYMYVFLKKPTN